MFIDQLQDALRGVSGLVMKTTPHVTILSRKSTKSRQQQQASNNTIQDPLSFTLPVRLDDAFQQAVLMCERSKEMAARNIVIKAMEANGVCEDSSVGLKLLL